MQSAFLLLSPPPRSTRRSSSLKNSSWDEMQQQPSANEPQQQQQQLSSNSLRELLVECAAAVSSSDWHRAIRFLVLLSRAVSPNGDSAERLAAYFSAALARCVYFLAGRYDSTIHSLLYSHNLLFGPDFHQQQQHQQHQHQQQHQQQQEFDFPDEEHSAYRALNQVTPFIRFAHLSANQAILEAVDNDRAVHIVDLEIMQGLQWPPLMQALAERRRLKQLEAEESQQAAAAAAAAAATSSTSSTYDQDDPQEQASLAHHDSEEVEGGVIPAENFSLTLRITGTGSSIELLEQTGARLRDFARTLNLEFEFDAICSSNVEDGIASLHRNLELRQGEALVVNCMTQLHRLLPASRRAALPQALEFIKNLSPRIVTVAEKEFEHDSSAGFMERFLAALDHYAAVFDSLEATLSPRNVHRLMIERLVLAKEIVGIVLEDEGGGDDESGDQQQHLVVRYQSFRRWKQGIEAAGFQLVPPSDFSIAQARLLLRLHYPADGYRLLCDEIEQGGGLFLSWQNKPLVALSAWRTSCCRSCP